MKRTGLFLTACVFHAVLFTVAAPAEPGASRTIDLRPLWKTGDAFYIEWEHDRANKWTQPGASISWMSHSRYIHGYILRVEEARPDGGARILLTYDRLAVANWWGDDESDGSGWDSDFDQPDAENQLSTVFHPIIGVSLTMNVDGDGRIISFKGVDELRDNVANTEPDPDAMDWFKALFDEEAQASGWKDLHGFYSFKPTERGDEWESPFTASHHNISVTSCLERINKNGPRVLATIQSKGQGRVRPDRKSEQSRDGTTWEYGDISYVARSTYDGNLGRIVSQREEGTMHGRRIGPDPETGEEIAYDVRTSTKGRQTTMTLEERLAQKKDHAKQRDAD